MVSAQKLRWYWNRLRCMSPAEIAYRTGKSLHVNAQRCGFFTARLVPTPDPSRVSRSWFDRIAGIDDASYCRAADSVVTGRLDIVALKRVDLGKVPRWNRNPLTGQEAPLVLGKTLDYRDTNVLGDIKYLWAANRHLHLVVLAQAYYLSRNQRYLDCIAIHLNSWMDQSPYLMGPNWTSSLEMGIRLINWSFVWHLVGGFNSQLFLGASGHTLKNRWLATVYQHAHFVQENFSRFSSANNHLIGEAAGLFVATTTWPCWRDFELWQKVAYNELVREILLQNSEDGVNREQATFYQQFVLDFLLIAMLVGRANGVKFPRSYWDRIEAMLGYLASVMDAGGHVPMIGDGDDGHVVRLSQEEGFCPYKSLLATGAILFARGDFKAKAGRLDDKTRWLLGKRAEADFSTIEANNRALPVRRAFPEGGYYVLGSSFETAQEIRSIVDAGPLGYQSIAAHGHADALSFTLSLGGREFLIDTGTYAYQSNKEWRTYFRGTSAHNTVRVDAENQSVIGGNFMWTHKANAHCDVWESRDDVDRFAGSHDGYERLRDPVTHRREICLYKRQRRIVITDHLDCQAPHLIERFWHFSENCILSLQRSTIVASNNGVSMQMLISDTDSTIEMRYGEVSPPSGWVSRRFNEKHPTTTVVARSKIRRSTTLITEILCGL